MDPIREDRLDRMPTVDPSEIENPDLSRLRLEEGGQRDPRVPLVQMERDPSVSACPGAERSGHVLDPARSLDVELLFRLLGGDGLEEVEPVVLDGRAGRSERRLGHLDGIARLDGDDLLRNACVAG